MVCGQTSGLTTELPFQGPSVFAYFLGNAKSRRRKTVSLIELKPEDHAELAHYVYDHSGERVLKTIITGSILNTNSQGQSVLRMESPTVYVNPYYIASHYLETELASKHYYMGSQRIASALVSLPFNAGSQTDPGMGGEGEEGEGPVFGEGNLSTSEDAVIQDLSATFNCLFGRTIELDYDGMLKLISIGEPILFDDCEGGESSEASEIDPTCACEQSTYWAQIGGVACNTMPIMYWYHPDYLGSVEFVTDMNGDPYQFFHNTIWGENLQNHMAFSFKSFSSRFRFNGKEWDEETGNFYYGARYYDPKGSIWLSADPLAGKASHLTPYRFSFNNPLNVVDPNGLYETGYDLDKETGQLSLAEGENADLGGNEYDVIIAEDGTQKRVEKGVIDPSNLAKKTTEGDFSFELTLLDVSSRPIDEGVELFKWLSSKSDNEFAFTGFSRINGRGSNGTPRSKRYISNSWEPNNPNSAVSDISGSYLINNENGPYFLLYAFHSHPTNGWSVKEALTPSGIDGDIGFRTQYGGFNESKAKRYNTYNRILFKKYGFPNTDFRIYSPEHKKWNPF